MKMIASSKLAKAQKAMEAGKAYGIANKGTCGAAFPHMGVGVDIDAEVFTHVPSDKPTPNKLIIVISSR